jgi:hypothetical protein
MGPAPSSSCWSTRCCSPPMGETGTAGPGGGPGTPRPGHSPDGHRAVLSDGLEWEK